MWKSKKLWIPALIIAVVLIASTAGIVMAQTPTPTPATPPAFNPGANFDRALEIYKQNTGTAIDKAKLQDALNQAQKEARDKALDTFLQNQVTAGKMTADQAKQYKDWVNSKPNVPGFAPFRGGPMMRGFGFRGGCWGGNLPPAPPAIK
jgi:hypothetical protein